MAKTKLPHPSIVRARVLLARGQTDQAIKELEPAYAADSSNDELSWRLAMLYVTRDRLAEARVVVDAAVAADKPTAGLAQTHLALMLAEQRPHEEVCARLDDYVARLHEDEAFCRYAAYNYATVLKQPHRALELMQRILGEASRHPDPECLVAACVAAWQATELKLVIEYGLPLVEAGHDNPFLYHAVLRAAAVLHDAALEARLLTLYESQWRQRLALVPILSEHLMHLGELERARALLREGLAASSDAAQKQLMEEMLRKIDESGDENGTEG